jgi:hypothetical protein
LILLATLAALLTLPVAGHTARLQGESLAAASRQLAASEKELSALQTELGRAQPSIDEGEMLRTLQQQSQAYLGNVVLVLNGAPNGLAFSTVKSQVNSGVLAVQCQAEAESYSVIEEFLASASKGPSVKASVLAATRKSELLGPDGLNFEYTKKVQVGN